MKTEMSNSVSKQMLEFMVGYHVVGVIVKLLRIVQNVLPACLIKDSQSKIKALLSCETTFHDTE